MPIDISLLGKRYVELDPTVDILSNSLLAIYKMGEPELNKITFGDFQKSIQLKNVFDFDEVNLQDGHFVRWSTTADKFGLSVLFAEDIPNLDASKIVSGTLNVARIPDLTISKISNLSTELSGKEPSFSKGNVVSSSISITNGIGRVVGPDNLQLEIDVAQIVNEIRETLNFFEVEKFIYSDSYVFTLQEEPARERLTLFHVGTKLGVILDDSLYSVIGNQLTINTELEVGDTIQIEYYFYDPLVPTTTPNLQNVTNVGSVTSNTITHAPATLPIHSVTLGQVQNLLQSFATIPSGDILLRRGFITTDGSSVIVDGSQINREFRAIINGSTVINNTLESFVISAAAVGEFRKDLIVMLSTGAYQIVQGNPGVDQEAIVLPNLPINSIAIGDIDVNDSGVSAVSTYVDGAFVSYSFNQNLSPAQQSIGRNNIDAFRRNGADTRSGNMVQNGTLQVNGNLLAVSLINNTASSLGFSVTNPTGGGITMQRRGSTTITASGDSLTAYFILRLNGSDLNLRAEFTNNTFTSNLNQVFNGLLTQNGNATINGSFTTTAANLLLNTGRQQNDDNHVVSRITNGLIGTPENDLFKMWNRGGMLFRAFNSNHSGWRFFNGDSETLIFWLKLTGRIQHSDAVENNESATLGQVNSLFSNTVVVSGTEIINFIPKFTGVKTIGNSQLFDNGTNVGIGTITPSAKLDVVGDAKINGVDVGRGGGNIGTNTILGIDSLKEKLTGGFDLSIGRDALKNLLSGQANTAIGNAAGAFIAGNIDNPHTISNSSIYIGSNASPFGDDQINQIVIGVDAIGGGSNTVTIGNSSILSNRFFGTMRVGTIDNLGTTTTNVLVPNATGVIHLRTVVQLLADMDGVPYTGATKNINIGNFGILTLQRSVDSTFLIRRDELPFNYSQTISTTGIIHNLVINEDTKLLVITVADELTGIAPSTLNVGRELKIEFRTTCILRGENAGSVAANRFAGSDLTGNDGDVYTFIHTNSRWRRAL